MKVRLTVITSNGLDNASTFRLETADISAAEKPSNYSFSKSALYDRPLTPQSTCDNLTKNRLFAADELGSFGSGWDGVGPGYFKQQK